MASGCRLIFGTGGRIAAAWREPRDVRSGRRSPNRSGSAGGSDDRDGRSGKAFGDDLAGLRLGGRGVAAVLVWRLAQFSDLVEVVKLFERVILDLSDPLAGHVEIPADLVERPWVLAVEAVAQLEYATLAIAEPLQRVSQRLAGEDLGGALVGRLGLFVGDELTELRFFLITDRLFERDRSLRGALDRPTAPSCAAQNSPTPRSHGGTDARYASNSPDAPPPTRHPTRCRSAVWESELVP
jgi:hypothetical protein